jgi:hypothetical protein
MWNVTLVEGAERDRGSRHRLTNLFKPRHVSSGCEHATSQNCCPGTESNSPIRSTNVTREAVSASQERATRRGRNSKSGPINSRLSVQNQDVSGLAERFYIGTGVGSTLRRDLTALLTVRTI